MPTEQRNISALKEFLGKTYVKTTNMTKLVKNAARSLIFPIHIGPFLIFLVKNLEM